MINIVTYRREFGLILVGAIIFTASFLWKDMFTDIKDQFFPKHHGMTGRLLFTIVITAALIMLAVHLKFMWNLSDVNTSVMVEDPTANAKQNANKYIV